MSKLSLATGPQGAFAGTAIADRPAARPAPANRYASAEQLAYAGVLQIGMRLSLALMAVAFAAYMLGMLPLAVPASDMPHYWTLSATAYLDARGLPHHGLPWLQQLLQGDLVFGGIALMAAVTVGCYAYFLRFPLRSRDGVMTAVVAGEIVVLSLAASGLLAMGH